MDISLPIKTDITVPNGVQPGIQLSGYENVIKHIKTEVKNNVLYVTVDLGDMWDMNCDDVTAQITVPAINALTLTGAPDASASVMSAGRIELNVQVPVR